MEKIYLIYHLKKYPHLTIQDKIKLIYQGSLGPSHYLSNINKDDVIKHVTVEIRNNTKENVNENLYEFVSEKYLRINLLSLEKNNINLNSIIDSFVLSSNQSTYNEEDLKANLANNLPFFEYQDYNFKPVHHSDLYNHLYNPHYLLINNQYLDLSLRIKQLVNYINKKPDHSIIALEGKCASGKTTITNAIKNDYTIIHCDDFFLKQNLKTEKRLSEIGGNIDYELLSITLKEIKKAWENKQSSITIKVFDCKEQKYYEKEINLLSKVILEGVYSYHPYFQNLINGLAFVNLDDKTQMQRISKRPLMYNFIHEWIPLENKYYNELDIASISDIII